MLREKRRFMKENCNNDLNLKRKFQAIVQNRINEVVNVKKEIIKVNDEIKDLRRARRIRDKQNITIDFLEKNVEEVECFDEIREANLR